MIDKLLFSITKKDLIIEFFSGTGSGGQYRNKHQNCVRIKHKESGVLSTGQSNRNRMSNIKEALNNLIKNPKFKLWINKRVYELDTKKSIEDIVEEMMKPENIKIEYKENNEWKEYNRKE